jgi:hypothetical protein
MLSRHRLQLAPDMPESAVAGQANDRIGGACRLGADRHGKSPAEAGESAWAEEAHSSGASIQIAGHPHG